VDAGMAAYDPTPADFAPERRNSFWRGL